MELTQKPPTAELLLTSLARQNLSALIKAIQHMEHYWAGISYVSGILDTKTVGLAHVRIDPSKKTFISLPDKGLLRRFTSALFLFLLYLGLIQVRYVLVGGPVEDILRRGFLCSTGGFV